MVCQRLAVLNSLVPLRNPTLGTLSHDDVLENEHVEVTRVDGDDSSDRLSTTGETTEKSITLVDEGEYQFVVEVDGEWTLTVSEP